jgi:hypothetical protein
MAEQAAARARASGSWDLGKPRKQYRTNNKDACQEAAQNVSAASW